ncbi:MAG: DUF6982 domain-containing protein [Deltaproteobacteria bacterium]|nr:hypothetical protein [Candidatus Deferrimicrobiaceae bacterium]
MQNQIVVRYQDGRFLKGVTTDFIAGKEVFHVTETASSAAKPVEVQVSDLKAVFFVKDLVGNPDHKEQLAFDPSKPVAGRKIYVLFKDGERIVGLTQGYKPGRAGFFLVPADPRSNNERIYIVTSSTQEIKFL